MRTVNVIVRINTLLVHLTRWKKKTEPFVALNLDIHMLVREECVVKGKLIFLVWITGGKKFCDVELDMFIIMPK